VHSALLSTLTAHDQVAEVAACPSFVEPQLPPAVVFGPVNEPVPIQVVHVSLRARTHETGGHHLSAVVSDSLVERFAMDQTARTLALLPAGFFLHDEPFGKPPRADAPDRLYWIVQVWRRRVQPRRGHARHHLELAREPGFNDLVQIPDFWPCVEPTDYR
jgi:hypothetical protein